MSIILTERFRDANDHPSGRYAIALAERSMVGTMQSVVGVAILGNGAKVLATGAMFNIACLVVGVALLVLCRYVIHNRLDWKLAVLADRLNKWTPDTDENKKLKTNSLIQLKSYWDIMRDDSSQREFALASLKHLTGEAEKENVPHPSFFLRY